MLPCSMGGVNPYNRKFALSETSMRKRLALAALAASVLAPFVPVAHADWPDRPIKWVVPFSPGGANDLIARAAAEGVAKRVKQPVVIENKPGAGAAMGAE